MLRKPRLLWCFAFENCQLFGTWLRQPTLSDLSPVVLAEFCQLRKIDAGGDGSYRQIVAPQSDAVARAWGQLQVGGFGEDMPLLFRHVLYSGRPKARIFPPLAMAT